MVIHFWIDPIFIDFVKLHRFEDIIQKIAYVNSSDVQRLVSFYNQSNSGYFNYFNLLSDICNQENELQLIGGGLNSYSRGSNPVYDDYEFQSWILIHQNWF